MMGKVVSSLALALWPSLSLSGPLLLSLSLSLSLSPSRFYSCSLAFALTLSRSLSLSLSRSLSLTLSCLLSRSSLALTLLLTLTLLRSLYLFVILHKRSFSRWRNKDFSMERWEKISIDTSGRNDIFHDTGLVAFSTFKELQCIIIQTSWSF